MNDTNTLLELHSVLRLYCSNLSNLHWNSCGEEFNDAHVNITDGLIDLFHKWIDPVGEMLTRLDINPLNYAEVFELIKASNNNYFIADSKKYYKRADIIVIANVLLGDIVKLICTCLESEEMKVTINAGIKADLETMLNDFDLQYRYLNKRRLSCCSVVPTNNDVPDKTPEVTSPEEDEDPITPSPVANEEDDYALASGNDDPDAGEPAVCPECGQNPCICNSSSDSLW